MIGTMVRTGDSAACEGALVCPARSGFSRCDQAGFTLVELLVSITVILTLAGLALVAVNSTRQEARIARTKATIAKLDHIVMQRYEAFRTRRPPVDLTGLGGRQAAEVRYRALLFLMRMEMPERINDIKTDANFNSPVPLPYGRTLPWSGLAIQYGTRFKASPATADYQHAEMLFAVVTADPENRELFHDDEIRDVDGDGWPEFIDGWGMPIYWLRWAPGFTIQAGLSEIQSADPVAAHDPFDSHRVQADAYHLIPLIYSAGPDRKYGVNVGQNVQFNGNAFADLSIGSIDPAEGNAIYDNIHNHHIEQR